MAVDYALLERELAKIDWGDGLTRDGIRLRWKGFPRDVYLHLPSEKVFRGADEVLMFARVRLELAAQPEPFDEVEVAAEGGPTAWGESPTGITESMPDLGSGVGSGTDPGYTGGGSVQTGVGPEGTTYGDEATEREDDRD